MLSEAKGGAGRSGLHQDDP